MRTVTFALYRCYVCSSREFCYLWSKYLTLVGPLMRIPNMTFTSLMCGSL